MNLSRLFVFALAASLFAVGFASAQDAPGKKKIAITKISATDALLKRMSNQGVTLSIESVLQALESQVYDRVLNTRRFEVLERADADALATEAAAAGSAFQFNQADYLLTIRVDSFNDRLETRKLASLGKDGMAARLAEGEAAGAALAQAFKAGAAADDPANDPLLARHHAWIAAMWDKACPPEAYAGLADLYLEHPDFRANFDKNGAGFAEWLSSAMKAYAARLAA